MATVPFWLFSSMDGVDLRLLSLVKFLRIQPTLVLNFHSENVKLFLKLLNLIGFLLLYIHVTACYLYHVAEED